MTTTAQTAPASVRDYMEYKTLKVATRLAAELPEGQVRFVATADTDDRDGDVVDPSGARLDAFMRNPVFLWAHDYGHPPIGRIVAIEVEDGRIVMDVEFDLDDDFAAMIYRKYTAKFLNAVSIGFIPVEWEQREDGGFRFTSWEMLELSAVPVPSNPDALALLREAGGYNNAVIEWARKVMKADLEGRHPTFDEALAQRSGWMDGEGDEPRKSPEEIIRMMGDEFAEALREDSGARIINVDARGSLVGSAEQRRKLVDMVERAAREQFGDTPTVNFRVDDSSDTVTTGDGDEAKIAHGEYGVETGDRTDKDAEVDDTDADEAAPLKTFTVGFDVDTSELDALQERMEHVATLAEKLADITAKEGQVLNARNREHAREIIRRAAAMLDSNGDDPMEVLADMADDGKGVDLAAVVKALNEDTEAEIRGLLEGKARRLDVMQDLIGAEDFNEDTAREFLGLLRADQRAGRMIADILGASYPDGGAARSMESPGELVRTITEGARSLGLECSVTREEIDVTGPDDQSIRREVGDYTIRLSMPSANKAVVDYQDLPLTDREREWDSGAAVERIREATDSTDEPGDNYRRAFLWYDADEPDEFGSYKMPIADVVDSNLVAVPGGVFAAAAAVQGARGGVDIPDEDMAGVRAHLERYYAKMREEFDDDSLVAPWDEPEEDAAPEGVTKDTDDTDTSAPASEQGDTRDHGFVLRVLPGTDGGDTAT